MKIKKKKTTELAETSTPKAEGIFLPILALSQIVIFALFLKHFPFQNAWNGTMDFLFKLSLPNAAMSLFMGSRLLLIFLIVATAFFIGRFVLGLAGPQGLNPLEIFAIGTLLGYCVIGLVVFGIGFLHLYKADLFWGASAVVVIAGLWWSLTKVGKQRSLESAAAVTRRLASLPMKPLLAVSTGFALVMAFVPEIFYDALVYHIGLPHLYLLEGGFVDTPNVQLSRFPLLIQSLYLVALPLGGDALAKLVHWSFLIFGVLMIVVLVDRLEVPSAGAWGAMLMICVPVVQMNVWTTAVDVAMGVLALTSVTIAVMWSQKEENDWRLLCLSGFFMGNVFGTKYTGFLFIFAMNAFLIALLLRKQWSYAKRLQILFVFNAVAFVTLLPWLIRNVVYAHNPLYPFLGSIFPNENLVAEKIAAQSAVSKGFTPANLWGWFVLPWTLAVAGQGSSFDFLGPAVVAVLPAVYFFYRRKTVWSWGVFFTVYFLIGGYLSRHARYLMPGVMLLAVLSGLGLGSLVEDVRSQTWKVVFKVFAVILVSTQLLWSVSVAAIGYAPYDVLSGKESRAAYVNYYHPGMNPYPPNNIFEDLKKLPPTAKVMFIGEEKVFGCPRPFVYSNVYDKTPFVEMANASENAEQLLEKLRAMGVTHLVINVPEAMRFKGYQLFPWDPVKIPMVQTFFQEKTTILAVRDTDKQTGVVLLALDGNPNKYPTWATLAPGLEPALELKRL